VHVLLAARTAWSNPDDVVKQLVAVDGEQILRGKGPELAKPIIAAAPNSPFANDFRAGATGMLMPMSLVGVLAAVAIPAFMDYMKKSKKPEALLQLNRIGKSLKRYYAENSTFPAGDAGPKDAAGCCGGKTADGIVNNKCPADPKAWQNDKIWSALEFSIDEPTLYQYRYHSDGQSAVVEAIGDADCDTHAATFRLDVKLNGGVPVMDMHSPPPGIY
jgi:type IV pilus assembly protein PilA